MKIQIDVPANINKKLKVYKVEKELKNMSEAIINILREKFDIKEKKSFFSFKKEKKNE